MVKRIFFIVATLIIVFSKLIAQESDKKIDQLMFLFVDEKYDKVVDKALVLEQNDNYRKNPLVYIYCSMGYYHIAKNPDAYDIEKFYSKPLINAQKYAYKFTKKDKKGEYKNDYEEFFLQLQDTSNVLGQHYFVLENYRKSASTYKNTYRFTNDPVMLMWQALAEIKSRNTAQGSKNLLLALEQIDENFVPNDVSKPIIARGLLLASEYFASKDDYENKKKAEKLVEIFKKYDPEVLDKKKQEEKRKKELEEAKKREERIKKFYSEEDDEDISKD
jgi:hypothetical protein